MLVPGLGMGAVMRPKTAALVTVMAVLLTDLLVRSF